MDIKEYQVVEGKILVLFTDPEPAQFGLKVKDSSKQFEGEVIKSGKNKAGSVEDLSKWTSVVVDLLTKSKGRVVMVNLVEYHIIESSGVLLFKC